MVEAEPVIRAVLPDANVPLSVRSSGIPVVHGSTSQLSAFIDGWLAEHVDGIACVVGAQTIDEGIAGGPFTATSRVRTLAPIIVP